MLSFVSLSADIAIIIDDIGNTKKDSAAFTLPTEVAFSILPLKPLSTVYSRRAALQSREVMLHIPMESLAGKQLGPGAITANMKPSDIRQTLLSALNTVPDAVGLNNHMGSKLTQLTQPMVATMDFLNEYNLFFVDSRTTRYTKAQQIALERGVMSTKRNVFLDHLAEPKHIEHQFERLIRLSQKYGFAVGIGHPYPQTISYLQTALPNLQDRNIRLVTVSDIIKQQIIAKNIEMQSNKQLLNE